MTQPIMPIPGNSQGPIVKATFQTRKPIDFSELNGSNEKLSPAQLLRNVPVLAKINPSDVQAVSLKDVPIINTPTPRTSDDTKTPDKHLEEWWEWSSWGNVNWPENWNNWDSRWSNGSWQNN